MGKVEKVEEGMAVWSAADEAATEAGALAAMMAAGDQEVQVGALVDKVARASRRPGTRSRP